MKKPTDTVPALMKANHGTVCLITQYGLADKLLAKAKNNGHKH